MYVNYLESKHGRGSKLYLTKFERKVAYVNPHVYGNKQRPKIPK